MAGELPLAPGRRAHGGVAGGARAARPAAARGSGRGAALVRVGYGARVRPHHRGGGRRGRSRRPGRSARPRRPGVPRVAPARSGGESGARGVRRAKRRERGGVGAGVVRGAPEDGRLSQTPTYTRYTANAPRSEGRGGRPRATVRRRRRIALLVPAALAGGVVPWFGPGPKALGD